MLILILILGYYSDPFKKIVSTLINIINFINIVETFQSKIL